VGRTGRWHRARRVSGRGHPKRVERRGGTTRPHDWSTDLEKDASLRALASVQRAGRDFLPGRGRRTRRISHPFGRGTARGGCRWVTVVDADRTARLESSAIRSEKTARTLRLSVDLWSAQISYRRWRVMPPSRRSGVGLAQAANLHDKYRPPRRRDLVLNASGFSRLGSLGPAFSRDGAAIAEPGRNTACRHRRIRPSSSAPHAPCRPDMWARRRTRREQLQEG
jgi:hypothetical protein